MFPKKACQDLANDHADTECCFKKPKPSSSKPFLVSSIIISALGGKKNKIKKCPQNLTFTGAVQDLNKRQSWDGAGPMYDRSCWQTTGRKAAHTDGEGGKGRHRRRLAGSYCHKQARNDQKLQKGKRGSCSRTFRGGTALSAPSLHISGLQNWWKKHISTSLNYQNWVVSDSSLRNPTLTPKSQTFSVKKKRVNILGVDRQLCL